MCKKMESKLMRYIKASFPLIYITSSEEDRVERITAKVCASQSKSGTPLSSLVVSWEEGVGVLPMSEDSVDEVDFDAIRSSTQSLDEFVQWLVSASEGSRDQVASGTDAVWCRSVVFVKDLHYMFANPNPPQYRELRRFARAARSIGMVMVAVGPPVDLPVELSHEFVMLDCPLPDRDELVSSMTELGEVLAEGGDETMLKALKKRGAKSAISDAASGMTEEEALGSASLSLVTSGTLDRKFIAAQKIEAVGKNAALEAWTTESIGDVGGLDLLKQDLEVTARAFTPEARKFGIAEPKGILIAGVPGSGKSLTARAAASVFNRPILRFDVSKVFGSYVGQSEQGIRSAIKVAEACAPCVLLVEEIEKGFSGTGSSSDGGTTMRVFDTFLQWLQFKTAPVYVVATANRIHGLPPELLRKGRFDEIFFVDLPSDEERADIWEIHLKKVGRDSKSFDLKKLVEATKKFSGSEIEQAVHDGLRMSFSAGEEDLSTDRLLESVSRTKPLAETRKEDIKAMQDHGRKHFRAASSCKSAEKGVATIKKSGSGRSLVV
jgi:ATP-dependent 26S proteasome regulatory subunit